MANIATAGLLFRSRHENLNLRGAFLHVLGDTLGSLGAIIAGILMILRQWYLADPIVSVLVGALVLYSSWELVAESVDVLLEGTPRHLKVSTILSDLGRLKGVASVHDLHVWSITSGMTAMSCHLVLRQNEDAVIALAESSRLMREKYGIEHTTIQIEFDNRHPGDVVVWPHPE
jgi:cobalt-zinc-cadmium efflux system protein